MAYFTTRGQWGQKNVPETRNNDAVKAAGGEGGREIGETGEGEPAQFKLHPFHVLRFVFE